MTLERTQVFAIDRPHRSLLTQYMVQSLIAGPVSPLVMLVLYFRYHSMRYRFDAHGVTKVYGVLLRREVHLTYERIQDIHVSSGPVQRWLGLADLQVQTASGSAGAELVIEGLTEYEGVRDFLYAQMHGITDRAPAASAASTAPNATSVALLHEIRDELKASREALERAAERR